MHRYGRHGPRAWRTWRIEKFPSVDPPSSALSYTNFSLTRIEGVVIIVIRDSFGGEPNVESHLREVPKITEEVLAVPSDHADLSRTTTFIAKRVLETHPHSVQTYNCIEAAVNKLAFYGTLTRTRDLTDTEIKYIKDTYIMYFQSHSVRCSASVEEDELLRTAVQDSRAHFNMEQCHIYTLAGLRIGRLWNRAFPDIPTTLTYAQMYVHHFLHPETEVLWELPQGVFP